MAETLKMAAGGPEDDKKAAQKPKSARDIVAETITPSYLEMMTQASGFTFEIVDQQFTGGHAGMTDMRTKRIYLSAQHMEKMPPAAQRALIIHEGFHHNPVVVELQNKFEADLKNPDIIPSFIPDNPKTRQKYLQALRSHMHNALADVWLEAYAGRGAHAQVRSDLRTLYEDIGERKTLTERSKPEQLVQYIVGEARYGEKPDLSTFVASDVALQIKRIESKGGMRVMQASAVWNSPFSTDFQKEKAITDKYEMYRRLFLPAYNELLKAEADKRNEEKQAAKEKREDADDAGGGTGEKKKERGEKERKEREQGFQDSMNDLLDDLTKSGEEQFGSQAPSNEDIEKAKEILGKINEIADKVYGKEGGNDDAPPQPLPQPERSLQDIMSERAERAEQSAQEGRSQLERGLGKQYGVESAVIRKWFEIKEKHRGLIDRTADHIAEIMIKDRQLHTRLPRRDGEVIPGLESITAIEIMSGNAHPDTMQDLIRNPDFLELKVAFLVDTSGSMFNGNLDKSIEMLVVFIEAIKLARQRIQDAGQLNIYSNDENEPLAVSVTAFTSVPRDITPFEEPLTDQKEITIMAELPRVSGGTSETASVEKVYKELKATGSRGVKIMAVLSDGAGDGSATLAPIMQEIQADEDVIFLAIGLGQSATQVVSTYLGALNSGARGNVFAMERPEMNDALLKDIVDFIGKQLESKIDI